LRGRWSRFIKTSDRNCIHRRFIFGRLRGARPGVLLDGSHWCMDRCLENALARALRRVASSAERTVLHRVPLGLLMLSRRELAPEQLRSALEEQRRKGFGRIGEWLQALGFVSEQQVTAALARQWSCPISRLNSVVPRSGPAPQIPITLLEKFSMIPVDYVLSTNTLFVAFGEGIDYPALYAIEQMLGCSTAPCMTVPSFVRTGLQLLSGQQPRSEVVFEHIKNTSEFCRIVRNYCVRVRASEIRLAACGSYRWIRILRHSSQAAIDLLMSLPSTNNFTSDDSGVSSDV
jgi:hypothetical protein